MSLAQQYDGLLKTLSPQEKQLAGGIVFRIRNFWTEFQMVGIMADREMAREMIDTLVFFYQNPGAFEGKQGSLIVPEKEKREN